MIPIGEPTDDHSSAEIGVAPAPGSLTDDRLRLSRAVWRLTITLVVVVMVAVPVGYFVVAHGQDRSVAKADVRRMGVEVYQFITLTGPYWYFQDHRLEEILHRQKILSIDTGAQENYDIRGPKGETLVTLGEDLDWPVMTEEHLVRHQSEHLASVILRKSYRDHLLVMAWLAVIWGLLTGFFYYAVIRQPTRILNGTFNRLAKSEQRLLATLSELTRAVKREEEANLAKSAFLASVSHDLRTPLNAIIGFSNIIKGQYFGPLGHAKYAEYADHISDSGEHLLELVNDLLDLSAIEAGKRVIEKEALIVTELLADCETIVNQSALAKNISLAVDVAPADVMIYADRKAVIQILINLLSNAIKFTDEGGRIDIFARAGETRASIVVSDNGCGIPADKVATITNPFTTAQAGPYQSHDGWGLGLAIVLSLVDLLGGEFQIQSKQGVGTSVTLFLPTVQSEINPAV